MLGEQLGGYRILERLAQGGMGEVWLAEALPPAKGRVAIKTLTRLDEPRIRRRFLDEMKLCATLSHPNIVQVLETGTENDRPYIIMEWIDGYSLHAVLRLNKQLPTGFVAALASQALSALAYAHRDGLSSRENAIVHRDLKPSNLLLTRDGQLKVIDFGIARAQFLEQTQTATGNFNGTLRYACPEQVGQQPTDGRSDLFSLSIVLYELCTGKPLFKESNEAGTLGAILFTPTPPLKSVRPDLPDALADAIDQSLRKTPSERPATATEMARKVISALPTTPWTNAEVAAWVSQQTPELDEKSGASSASNQSLAPRAGQRARNNSTAPGTNSQPRQHPNKLVSRPRFIVVLLVVGAASLAILTTAVRKAIVPVATSTTENRPVPDVEKMAVVASAPVDSTLIQVLAEVDAGVEVIETSRSTTKSTPFPRRKRTPPPAPTTKGSGFLKLGFKGDSTRACDVYLGSRRLGVTPLWNAPVPAGAQTIEVACSGMPARKVKVQIPEDAELKMLLNP